MKSTYIFLLTCLFPVVLVAQKKLKFGKIPAEDLMMTSYAPDTSAAAVILHDKANLSFVFTGDRTQTRTEVHRRTKILKRAGFDQGDVTLYFSNYRRRGKITGLKVKVFNPDGTEYSLKNSEIFEEKVSDDISAKKFSAPGLQEGSVIDYTYSVYSENIFSLQRFFFQYEIPVRFSEYTVEIPKFYKYLELINGASIYRDDPVTRERTVSFNQGGTTGGLVNGAIDFTTTRYYAENLPALKKEAYVTTMEDYRANIQFQLSQVNFTGQPRERILTSWGEVANTLTNNDKFGRQYDNLSNFNKVYRAAEPAFAGKESETDIVQTAYNFVLNNIENNDNLGVMTESSLNKVFEQKSGSGAEMNLMLLALLRKQGINAAPVLISTREHGKTIEIYPIVNQFNHVIIIAEADGETLFLDATDKNRPMNYIGVEGLNKRGWIVGETPQWINIVPNKAKSVLLANLTLDETGDLNGDLNVSATGYAGFSEISQARRDRDKEGKNWQKALAENFPDAEVSEVEYEGTETGSERLKMKMECSLPGAAQVTDEFIYFNPIIYTEFTENPFKTENRLFPVEIPYPMREQLIVNIDLPEGYAVEEIPEQISLLLPNKGGKYTYLISQKENSLQVVRKLNLSQLNFPPEEYQGIKDFFNLIVQKENAQIVLKRL